MLKSAEFFGKLKRQWISEGCPAQGKHGPYTFLRPPLIFWCNYRLDKCEIDVKTLEHWQPFVWQSRTIIRNYPRNFGVTKIPHSSRLQVYLRQTWRWKCDNCSFFLSCDEGILVSSVFLKVSRWSKEPKVSLSVIQQSCYQIKLPFDQHILQLSVWVCVFYQLFSCLQSSVVI